MDSAENSTRDRPFAEKGYQLTYGRYSVSGSVKVKDHFATTNGRIGLGSSEEGVIDGAMLNTLEVLTLRLTLWSKSTENAICQGPKFDGASGPLVSVGAALERPSV